MGQRGRRGTELLGRESRKSLASLISASMRLLSSDSIQSNVRRETKKKPVFIVIKQALARSWSWS
jgi:hypothetical protein